MNSYKIKINRFFIFSFFRILRGVKIQILAIFRTFFIHFLLSRYFPLFEAIYKKINTMQCLKCIIKWLYQFVFKFGKILDLKFTYLSNYWRFCDFDPSTGHFLLSGVIFLSLRLYIIFLDTMQRLKSIIKCLYQFVFKFDQFLDFKLTYLLNYCQFFDFDPSKWHFWLLCTIFLSLRLNKNILDIKECLKCIIKCLYQFVFKFDQFLDFKLAYLSNYWRFCDFDPLL